MSAPRVYHPVPLEPGGETALPAAAAHHLVRVLRTRVDDEVVVFNGQGGEYRCAIVAAGAGEVRVRVEAFDPADRESRLAVTLAQVVSTGERMDYTVQKAVELGVTAIQPLGSDRSRVRLSGERAARRAGHWQGVAVAACEQCGRNRVPEVRPLVAIEDWLAGVAPGAGSNLLLSPRGEWRLSGIEPPRSAVTILAGAEAGLAREEEELALARGFQPVRLGPRVLRTETAAPAAIAVMQGLWGDF